ncbi:MAG: hypothetical protein AAGI51_09680 [Pseudomonadota bacterium]
MIALRFASARSELIGEAAAVLVLCGLAATVLPPLLDREAVGLGPKAPTAPIQLAAGPR